MAPPRKVSPCEISEKLKGLKFFDDNGAILNLSAPVYQEATDILNGRMSKKHIYLYIRRNDHNIQSILKGEDTVTSPIETQVKKQRLNTSDQSNWSMDSIDNALPPLRTTMTIKDEDSTKMMPYNATYKGRSYLSLKPGWTDILYSHLWNNLKLPCAFAFKRAKVSLTPGELYLKVIGKCTECGTQINISANSPPMNDGLSLNVSTFDTKDVEHSKKRELRNPKRTCVVKELQSSSTYSWRRQKAEETMSFGDKEPADLYSENVLRKAKQEARDRELGLVGITDPIQGVFDLKYKAEFKSSIVQIGLDKFFVIYFTPEQMWVYKHFLKTDPIGRISIDATGSIIAQIERPDGTRHAIFLYQAVTGLNGKILPLFQMVSEKHDANMLSYWMRVWLSSGAPYPREVVTDNSKALLNAVALTFCDCKLSTYIDKCLSIAEGKTHKSETPYTKIRLDIAHLIKAVCNWKCFKNTDCGTKEFFVRCIGFLTDCTSLAQFRNVMVDILTVALSPTEDIRNKENICFAAQQRLDDLIRTKEMKDREEVEAETETDAIDVDSEDFHGCTGTEIKKYLRNLETECRESLTPGNRRNPYYCPDFVPDLMNLSLLFPLWTGIWCTTESVATSARSEEYFREIKRLIFMNRKKIRADKFLVEHIRSLSGTMKILYANANHDDKPVTSNSARSDNAHEINQRYTSCANSEDDKGDSTDKTEEIVIECDDQKSLIQPEVETPPILQFQSSDDIRSVNIKEEDERQNDPESGELEFSINQCLKEEEQWRGKNKPYEPAKKRGKYLTCLRKPLDISKDDGRARTTTQNIIHKKIPLLKNATFQPPIRIEKKLIKVTNTCPFDAISQCIIVACFELEAYQNFIENATSEFLQFVKKIVNTGISQESYRVRGHLMYKFIPLNDKGVLNCEYNLNRMCEYLMEEYTSVEINIECRNCTKTEKHSKVCLDIDPIACYQSGLAGIENNLNKRYVEVQRSCTTCDSYDVNRTVTSGHHLIIDTECLTWVDVAKRCGFADWSGKYTVLQLPIDIRFAGKAYTLIGAIEYNGATSTTAVGHYRTMIRRRYKSLWEMHDGMSISNQPQAASSRDLYLKRQFQMVIYILSE